MRPERGTVDVAEYQTLAGPVLRVMFTTRTVQRVLRKRYDSSDRQLLAILRSVITWNITDAEPRASVWKAMPVDVPEGIGLAIIAQLVKYG